MKKIIRFTDKEISILFRIITDYHYMAKEVLFKMKNDQKYRRYIRSLNQSFPVTLEDQKTYVKFLERLVIRYKRCYKKRPNGGTR